MPPKMCLICTVNSHWESGMEKETDKALAIIKTLSADKRRVAMEIIRLLYYSQTVVELEAAAAPLLAAQGCFVEKPALPQSPRGSTG
jgi:hypothetical protein